jgi:hypothetical protein
MARQYTDELRAQVIADAALGMSRSAIARKHDIPRTTVIAWVSSHEPPLPTVSDNQKQDLGALVYDYLVAGLEALSSQARVMGDPEWFKGQGATAHFIHGTLADKLVIVFGGVERGAAEANADPS